MQKCPQCGFRAVHVEEIRDKDGNVVGSRTVCSNCQSTLNEHWH